MITLYHHPDFAAPIGEHHIMPMRKFALVAEQLQMDSQARIVSPMSASLGDLRRVHTEEYVQAIRMGEPRSLAESQKFPWSKQLFASVCLTSGGVMAAAETALRERVSGCLASGFHHAHADHGEGFCTFNGLVIAVDALRSAGKINRAAVLDLDLHYGNGTASLAAQRPYLLAISIYGSDYWQNKAYTDTSIIRHQDGPNHLSIPLKNRLKGLELLQILNQSLPLLLKQGKPDLLLYQAGADPLRDDPYSPLDLSHEDLYRRDLFVFEFANKHQIPIAWVLAGGYSKEVAKVIRVHMNTFAACAQVYA